MTVKMQLMDSEENWYRGEKNVEQNHEFVKVFFGKLSLLNTCNSV